MGQKAKKVQEKKPRSKEEIEQELKRIDEEMDDLEKRVNALVAKRGW
ncbi:MAG: hypothetical protein ACYDDV_00405 [Methanoregula sp.]